MNGGSTVSSQVGSWAIVRESTVDISFLQRQHRRRLSKTTQLALTAYHRCNPALEPCRTVFASRYGEYARTFGILEALAAGEPASPAAFSVSVHNAPSGILGMATENSKASNTVAANGSTIEAAFLDAAMQQTELENGEDVILVFADEPLPETYGPFRGECDLAYAFGLRLSGRGTRRLDLSWAAAVSDGRTKGNGVPAAGLHIADLLTQGRGRHTTVDERLQWTWTVG